MATNHRTAALLTIALLLPLAGCSTPVSVDRQTAITCQEDEPCWTCSPNDDRPCVNGVLVTPESEHVTAWNVWESGRGPSKLRLDPSRPFRVEYVGRSSSVPPASEGAVTLTGKDGLSYTFAVRYTDGM